MTNERYREDRRKKDTEKTGERKIERKQRKKIEKERGRGKEKI